LEVTQARADMVSAGQRPNSLVFFGAGKDGPVRVRSLEVIPKRWARGLAAWLAARVIEAQYQDAIRNHTAELHTSYVDVQEAQFQARYARSSLSGLESLAKMTKTLAESGQVAKADSGRADVGLARAALMASDAEVSLRKAKLTLADFLNLPLSDAERLDVNTEVDDLEPRLPSLAGLTHMALSHRPDLRAHRLGIFRAQAEWLRVWVEQWPDFYVLAGPDQRVRPDAGPRAIAAPLASGLLVSFPDAGHYQGKVARARNNITRWRIELTWIERQVAVDVRLAHEEYTHSLAARRRMRDEVIPAARKVRDDTFRQWNNGEVDLRAYLSAQSEYNQVASEYVKAAIRYRRGALALNTAVGKRVLP
jgi:cobalt-zinc-cadmium efflux system outer membrane protein